jgi:hypothetical protein
MTPCITSEGAPADSPVFNQPERAQYGPPASYTTSEGATYKLLPTRHHSSHIHRLLRRHSLYLGQWGHRHTNSIMRRAHTHAIYYLHRMTARQLPPNFPHRPRQAIYPQHKHHVGRLRFPRRRPTRIAPLTQHGLSATYTDTDLQISTPTICTRTQDHHLRRQKPQCKRVAFLPTQDPAINSLQRRPARTTR